MTGSTFDLGGEAYLEVRDDGGVIIGRRYRGQLLLDAEQVAKLREAFMAADEAADDFGL